MNLPKVSVTMPVYNGEKFIAEAIESILNQTYSNFEFIIIDDGSTDSTKIEIDKYKDKRITLITNKINKGIVYSLNNAIKISRGIYIARMDADDLSHPKRLEKQINFLEKNSNYGLLGTSFAVMNSKRDIVSLQPAIAYDDDLRKYLLIKNPFAHGSVMIRKSILIKNNLFYNSRAKFYEDYELWTQVSKFTKIANLQEVLYVWMRNPSGITYKKFIAMKKNANRFINKNREEIVNKKDSEEISKFYGNKKRYSSRKIEFSGKKYFVSFLEEYQKLIILYGNVKIKNGDIINGAKLIIISFIIKPSKFTILFLKFFLRKAHFHSSIYL